MASQKNINTIRAMHASAKNKGEDEVATAIEAVAGLLGVDAKKPAKTDSSGVDFTQSFDDRDYREFERLLDAN